MLYSNRITFFTWSPLIRIYSILGNMDNNIVRGRFINGAAVIFKKVNGKIVQGLELENGNCRWLDYDVIEPFYDDRAVVSKGWAMGYIDRLGIECVPVVYSYAERFSEGRAFVLSGNTTLLIDQEGKVIQEYEGTLVTGLFEKGTAVIFRLLDNGEKVKDGLINRDGNFIIPFGSIRTVRSPSDIHIEHSQPQWHEGILRFSANGNLAVADLFENVLFETR